MTSVGITDTWGVPSGWRIRIDDPDDGEFAWMVRDFDGSSGWRRSSTSAQATVFTDRTSLEYWLAQVHAANDQASRHLGKPCWTVHPEPLC